MPARLVLINGSPSAGKTTLLTQVHARLTGPWLHLELDQVLENFGPAPGVAPEVLWNRALRAYFETMSALLASGQDVLSETVMLPQHLGELVDRYERYSPFVVGLRCDLAEVHRRERERVRSGGFHYFVPEDEDAQVHAHGADDLTLDSSATPVEELCEIVVHALDQARFRGRALSRVAQARVITKAE